jgi:myo-inositol-1(or 4)-monophosphatase
MIQNPLSIQSSHLNVMFMACEKAARSLLRDFGEVEQLQVSRKGPGDFVTKADHKAEKIILEILKKARPEYAMLFEESGVHAGVNADFRWIVDPLDGTSNFIHAIPHFCISIGLEYKGEMLCGMIFDPVKNELFYAEKGRGAFLGNVKLRVSGRTILEDSLVGVAYPHSAKKNDPHLHEQVQRVDMQVASLRHFGSAALDLCYVAAGRFDGYWALELKPWDYAAGSLIVQEAGGTLTDVKGQPNFMETHTILAGNPSIHQALLPLLR